MASLDLVLNALLIPLPTYVKSNKLLHFFSSDKTFLEIIPEIMEKWKSHFKRFKVLIVSNNRK
jgi:hypothetical protein